MTRPTHAVIDLPALRANAQRVRACAPDQRIIAVIKANGYGHGAVRVAKTLTPLVDAFAVCCLEEAIELRTAHIALPIVLLEGFYSSDELAAIVHYDLQVVLHSAIQVSLLLNTQLERGINVWIKIDSGMHRLGFIPAEVKKVWEHLATAQQVTPPIRLLSHLACADDRQSQRTLEQIQRFSEVTARFSTETSLANSAGVLGWTQTHGDWVRPGIMLYGVSPFTNSVGREEELQTVMQLQSALISVKHYQKGEPIGYGATWRCPQSMPIGVVAIGYADGYPRHAPTGTPVLVNKRRVPLVGRVSMDMLTVDLRSQPNAKVGDPVILWGKGLPVEEVATHAGTIAYELLCNVSPRVQRIERS